MDPEAAAHHHHEQGMVCTSEDYSIEREKQSGNRVRRLKKIIYFYVKVILAQLDGKIVAFQKY